MYKMQLKANTSIEDNSSGPAENGAESNSISLDSFVGIFILLFYIIVYSASSVGNFVVLYICSRNGRPVAFQPTRTGFFNRYIANLAIADLLFTQLTVFDAVYAAVNKWIMGPVMCKLQGFLLELCYSASMLTLIAISRERLKSLSHLETALRIQRVKKKKFRSIVVWVVAGFICSPLLYAYSVENTPRNGISPQCNNIAWWHTGRQIYYSLTAAILFILPLIIMIWTQLKIKRVFKSHVAPNQQIAAMSRARQKKASRILGAVTLVFLALWSPFIFIRTLRYFSWYEGELIWKISQLFTIASAAANPFIYSFYSLHFRVFIKRFITCRCSIMAASAENVESSTANTLY